MKIVTDFLGQPREPVKLEARLIALEDRLRALEAAEKCLYVDWGWDWVGHAVHERMLADRDTRQLREHGAPRQQSRNL